MGAAVLWIIIIISAVIPSSWGRRAWSKVTSQPEDGSAFLDNWLMTAGDRLRGAGWDSITLDDFALGPAKGAGVKLLGTSRIERRGPAILFGSGTALAAKVSLGLKRPVLMVENFQLHGQRAPVNFTVGCNRFLLQYRVDLLLRASCSFTWLPIIIEELTDVLSASPEPHFNNRNMTHLFQDSIRLQLNKIFSSRQFLDLLQERADPCANPGPDPLRQLTRLVSVEEDLLRPLPSWAF